MDKSKTMRCKYCGQEVVAKLLTNEKKFLDGYHGECSICGWCFWPCSRVQVSAPGPYTIVWAKFDAALDAERLKASRLKAERYARIDEVVKCPHRKHKGFYNVKCEHPEREQSGRPCANTDCPVLFQ